MKKDAPSGTAARLLEIILEERKLGAEALRHGRHGVPGERTSTEVGIHALRGGDIVGDHTVMFAALGELLTLTHKASDRAIFARGALRAAKWRRGFSGRSWPLSSTPFRVMFGVTPAHAGLRLPGFRIWHAAECPAQGNGTRSPQALARASAAAQHAVTLAPNEPLTAITQARVPQAARLHADALIAARRAVALDTQHAVARRDLALLDARSRRPFKAVARFVDAGKLDPALPEGAHGRRPPCCGDLSWRLRVLLVVASVRRRHVVPVGDRGSRVAAAVILLARAALVGRTVRALPPQGRSVVRVALRTDCPLRFTYVAVTACVAIFLAVVVSGIGPLGVLVWGVLVVLNVVAIAVRVSRGRRRHR